MIKTVENGFPNAQCREKWVTYNSLEISFHRNLFSTVCPASKQINMQMTAFWDVAPYSLKEVG
jgi:hypothetical protein